MTIKEEDINELDQHRQGELSESEIKTLSDRLREDADFQRTSQLYETVVDGIRHQGRQELQKRLDQFHSETKQRNSLQQLVKQLWYAIAASLILAIFVGYWAFTPSLNERLFDEYFQPYPDVVSVRATDDHIVFAQAMEAYRIGDFHGALQYFQKISKDDQWSVARSFYKGICLLALKQSEMALVQLGSEYYVDTKYEVSAQWYRSLAYLQLGDDIEFSTSIQELVGTSYEAKVKQLQEALKRP